MLKKEFVYQEYTRREENILRAPYNPELEFYSVIKSGNIEKTKELCSVSFADKKGLGKLSENPLQNLKYHFVITIAMLARYCIDGGLDISTAFSVSDFYIMKADKAKNVAEIDTLHTSACIDYAQRMKKLRNKKITSRPVARCVDYIADHLHCKISLGELADYVDLNPSYLSRLFKKETGSTVSEYIMRTKIETAGNMLIYSEYTSTEIASILAFSDQSYFTEMFRKYMGVTPKKYQSMHLREIEMGKEGKK